MNRRSFLGLLGAAATGFALDPERLLWVPGAKTIFVPEVVRVRNTFAVPEQVMRLMAERLCENLKFATHVNRTYELEFAGQRGPFPSNRVTVRLPTRYDVLYGWSSLRPDPDLAWRVVADGAA